MRVSDLLPPRRWRGLALAILLFFALDTAVYRSGLYTRIMSCVSMQGTAAHRAINLERYDSDPNRDVLILGDSQITEGFNTLAATRQQAGSGLVFVPGGTPGSTMRSICFTLEHIDPGANRFRAIVLTVRSYRQSPGYDSITDDRMLDADFLAPVISAPAFLDFAASEPRLRDRIELWSRLLVAALNYRADANDLLLHPRQRGASLVWLRRHGLGMHDDYIGHKESMEGLAVSPQSGELVYPSWLNAAQRAKLHDDLTPHWPKAVPAQDAYLAHWIGRILRRYRAGATRVLIVRLPFTPMPQFFHVADYPLASFLAVAKGTDNVTVLPETAFTDLENPAYFFDGRHLNAAGRMRLTERLGGALRAVLTAPTPAAP